MPRLSTAAIVVLTILGTLWLALVGFVALVIVAASTMGPIG